MHLFKLNFNKNKMQSQTEINSKMKHNKSNITASTKTTIPKKFSKLVPQSKTLIFLTILFIFHYALSYRKKNGDQKIPYSRFLEGQQERPKNDLKKGTEFTRNFFKNSLINLVKTTKGYSPVSKIIDIKLYLTCFFLLIEQIFSGEGERYFNRIDFEFNAYRGSHHLGGPITAFKIDIELPYLRPYKYLIQEKEQKNGQKAHKTYIYTDYLVKFKFQSIDIKGCKLNVIDYGNSFYSTQLAHHGHYYFKQIADSMFSNLNRKKWKTDIMPLEKDQYHDFGETNPSDDDLNELNKNSFKFYLPEKYKKEVYFVLKCDHNKLRQDFLEYYKDAKTSDKVYLQGLFKLNLEVEKVSIRDSNIIKFLKFSDTILSKKKDESRYSDSAVQSALKVKLYQERTAFKVKKLASFDAYVTGKRNDVTFRNIVNENLKLKELLGMGTVNFITQDQKTNIQFMLKDSSDNQFLNNDAEARKKVMRIDGYKIITQNYGNIKDFLQVTMTSNEIHFFKKRYLRINGQRIIVEFDHKIANSSFGLKQKRFKFTHTHKIIDRVKITCLKNLNDDNESNKEDRKATLTYEIEPNLIYNFVFYPKCTEEQQTDQVELERQTRIRIVSGYDLGSLKLPSTNLSFVPGENQVKGLDKLKIIETAWEKGIHLTSDNQKKKNGVSLFNENYICKYNFVNHS